jgi:hypothetical protein
MPSCRKAEEVSYFCQNGAHRWLAMSPKSASLKSRIAAAVQRAKSDVFVPADFTDLGGHDQVLRALRKLVAEGILGKLGYVVYVRLETSFIDGSRVMTCDFGGAVRQTNAQAGGAVR